MNNRLTIHDLAAILAGKTGRDKKSIELFIRELIRIVTENIYSDKLVKVKGLGTFKIIPVEQRESIHVNTGERIVIPAHYKFSFHPDKELRDIVNQPFSFFETTELNPGVEFVLPEEELVADVPDAQSALPEDITPDNESNPTDSNNEEVLSTGQEETATEELAVEPEPEIIPTDDDLPVTSVQEEITPVETTREDKVPTPSVTANQGSLYPLIFTIIATILVTTGGIYYYLRHHQNDGTFRPQSKNIKNTISSIDNSKAQAEISSQEAVVLTDSIPIREQQDTVPEQTGRKDIPVNATPQPDAGNELSAEIATVKIEPGSRLTLIALEHYGHKLFWVYIYEYNKNIIDDPNNIPVGTVLKLPAKNLYDIDARNRKSLEKAAIKQTEILTGFQ